MSAADTFGDVGLVRCGVLGSPIAHSLSPVLHRAAYAELGLDWTYDAIEVTEEGLPGFLDGLDDTWRGLSLTMPLKRAVLDLLHEVEDRVRVSGVANTVVLRDGVRRGFNTDIPGAVAAVRERTDGTLERAVVLGGGATATSLLLALAELGCRSVTVLVRDPARAAAAVDAVRRTTATVQIEVMGLDTDPGPADIVLSTIPAAAQADLTERLAAPVVFDVIYHPWPTPFAAAARAEGRVLISGLDLLAHQAALQVGLMTGLGVPSVGLIRAAGEQALADRDEAR